MKEKKFKKLLDKYFEGTLSEEEAKLLEQFDEALISKNKNNNFVEDSEKIAYQETIWSEIEKSTKKKRIPFWKSAVAVAAVSIGILATVYSFLNTSGNNPTTIPENAITLEQEDGSIKIIEENGSTSFRDAKGNLIGQQDGNQLVYKKSNYIGKLVFNTLTIPYGKTFELQLSDGTIAHLNAGSSIKYPVQFIKGNHRQVFIEGEAYLKVAKDKAHPFIASSEDFNVRVLGTEFNFSAYPEDEVKEVVLVEGAVSLFMDANGYNDEKNTVLRPGLKGSFDRKTKAMDTQKVLTSTYTSWMSGRLVFRNMKFKNILKKLERHYNITIVNNNQKLSEKVFNANFGNQPIERVLKELQDNYGINYTVSDNEVTIQ